MASTEQIARTIADLNTPDMKPADLFQAVRKVHPKATKKEIRTGAFYSLILVAEANPLKVGGLYNLALKAKRDTSQDD